MPIKHQTDSFRIRKCEKYRCWTDVLSMTHRRDSNIVVQEMRKKKVRAFAEHNNDEGYSRVFIHETDAVAAKLSVMPGEIADFVDVTAWKREQ